MPIKIYASAKKLLSDTLTPVGLYLRLRDEYPNSLLLESSDYHKKQNSFSYICLKPLAAFKADRNRMEVHLPGLAVQRFSCDERSLVEALQTFVDSFQVVDQQHGFLTQGLFGYTAYDAIPLWRPIQFQHPPMEVPLVHYQYFQFVLVFNHFNNELYLVENLAEDAVSGMAYLEQLIEQHATSPYSFRVTEERKSNFSDAQFLELIQKGKEHCYRGDVFQVVLSRQFSLGFRGDEFNVYRALRSINPSPYLFYFDYGGYKIMGSSPEAQITVQDNKASIYPIAGTFRRSGNTELDEALAEALRKDPKENAEHVMLVDLARNDLSINSASVRVDKFKTIEMYSHVIHLVSKVEALLPDTTHAIEIFFNTFPAGTLSGAPKHRAMQIIDTLENASRGFYGGAVGILGLDGSVNHAIFIRSILSKDQRLYYQAGCGVVSKSAVDQELQEIYNKVYAVESAIAMAQKF